MNTMKNGDQDSRPEIKINRKMRMWNKYKSYCIIGGGIAAVLLVIVLIVNIVPGNKGNTKLPSESGKDTVWENKTNAADQTQGESQQESQSETQSESVTEAPTQTETEAPTQAPASSGTPEKQTFTAKDKFANSVFVGDTIVNGISFYKYLNASQVVSSTNMISEQIAGRAGEIAAGGPDKIFIMIGLNDANYGTRTTDQVLNNIKAAVQAIKARSSATIYVLSVMPVTKAFEGSSNVKQSFINELNYKLSTNASSFGANYIDVATSFKDSSGYLYSECTGSGYSLKTEYYPYMLNRIAASL